MIFFFCVGVSVVVVVVATGSCTTANTPWAYVTMYMNADWMDFRVKPELKRTDFQYLVDAVRRQRKRDLIQWLLLLLLLL
jgi:hypothetical protein